MTKIFSKILISARVLIQKTDNNEEDLLPLYDINDEKDNNKYDYEPKVFEYHPRQKAPIEKTVYHISPTFKKKQWY